MQRINYINPNGHPNSIAGKIIQKKSKVIRVQLPDDPDGKIREINRSAVEEIMEVEKLNTK